ncbi:hypothetical protein FIBSPDRAFT_848958 [Athelia psychrophila]|uniref:Uncharacterized protein n=1 Tax=Athelia psychrophila TaxID=1759441 RepID=A0A166USI4_9AGAM|nr:hypothetical protein FIBSPDRAFT_848958 [Fibularhizoctonia sp. CBS 109695]
MFIGARCVLLHLLRYAIYTHDIHIAASSSAWASPSQTAPPLFSPKSPTRPTAARAQLISVYNLL